MFFNYGKIALFPATTLRGLPPSASALAMISLRLAPNPTLTPRSSSSLQERCPRARLGTGLRLRTRSRAASSQSARGVRNRYVLVQPPHGRSSSSPTLPWRRIWAPAGANQHKRQLKGGSKARQHLLPTNALAPCRVARLSNAGAGQSAQIAQQHQPLGRNTEVARQVEPSHLPQNICPSRAKR